MPVMLSHALTASFADSAEQRISDRRVLRLQAQIATPSGAGGIQVHNLSKTGMLVEADAPVTVGESIEVELPGGATCRAEVVWADDALFGCRFSQPLTKANLSAALLRSEPQALETPAQTITHEEARAKLETYWATESAEAANDKEAKLPIGVRALTITGLALVGWAVPAATAYVLW
ncbi:PilZ domain-containing protein [Qipengyuania sp.]|uniref:PilZ domain-containing protein n=1 Tax=Qipengyuania sp. TaxID=2004515 RepID=UPI0035C83EA3